jgi:hypothetical protein
MGTNRDIPTMKQYTKSRPLLALDLHDEAEALRVAKIIAKETGRPVIVRDAVGVELETVYSKPN